MKAIYLDVKNGVESKVMEVKDDLQEFYKLLLCDRIDIVNRKIGNKRFSIVCDGEGLFTDSPKISAIDNMGKPMLVGNLIIVSANNDNGELEGLTQNEVVYVLNRIQKMFTHKYPGGYYMLTQCEY